MNIEISNNLLVHGATKELREWCRNSLVLKNPEYYKKVRLGKWVGNTPPTLTLYEQRGTDLVLPFGVLKDLWSMYPDRSLYLPLNRPIAKRNYTSRIVLYPYQETAVEKAILARNGVLVMPCGSGKTQCGIEIIARLGGKALWLTHTQDLLNQSKVRAESMLDIDGRFGKITAGKVDVGTHITFATVQTMCKVDVQSFRDEFDIVIVDEAQHCCGTPTRVTQFYKVVSNLNARYKFGLTATPYRGDGLHRSMFALLGDIVHEVSRAEVADTTCPIHVKKVPTGWTPYYDDVLMGDGTIDYNALINAMITDEDRFSSVLTGIENATPPVLVLANRVEYLQKLNKAYSKRSVCLSGMGNSKRVKDERKDVLNRLNNGDLDCVFATYQLAKEGLDVPRLNYVVFATPEKDETTVIQAVGRVGRKADGKAYGTVIDYVDNFGLYYGWSKKRNSYYKALDAEIS